MSPGTTYEIGRICMTLFEPLEGASRLGAVRAGPDPELHVRLG